MGNVVGQGKWGNKLHPVDAGDPPSDQGPVKKAALDDDLLLGDARVMNDITREEFNARLETIEVKMDARVEAISSKIDGFLATQAERDRRLDESIAGVRRDIDRLGSLKLNIWGAMLTAVGLGVAMAALSVTFYQTGKSDSSTNASAPPSISAPPAVPTKN